MKGRRLTPRGVSGNRFSWVSLNTITVLLFPKADSLV